MALLEGRGLTRRFGGLVAVDDVDLFVEEGETRAVIGPNGAGKSTLFNLITGTIPPSAGETIFAGEVITGLPVHEVVARGISRTFQLTHLFPQLTALENARIAAQAKTRQPWRVFGGGPVFRDSREAAEEALARLHLTRFASVPAGLLSHGDQRLLEVSMALAQRPKLLMLDEPTQGLSIEETDRAVDILREMIAAGGLTVVLVEHDMDVVFRLADRITVLHQGRVIADGEPAAVKANAEVQTAYLGGFE